MSNTDVGEPESAAPSQVPGTARGRARTWIALAGVGLLVVALGVYRAAVAPTPQPAPSAGDAAAEVHVTDLPVLLDFGRGECIPCQKMMPVLETLKTRHEGRVEVRYFDLGEPGSQARANELGVRIIPTQVLLDADGVERGRHEGFWALDEIEARLQELGWTSRP